MAQSSILGLPTDQTHVPHQRFNLFHIDTQEKHLDSFGVSIFDPSTNSKEPGVLHLCSRSVVYDSDTMSTDLLKLRFSPGTFSFDNFCGEELQQVVQSYQVSGQVPTSQSLLYSQLYELLAEQAQTAGHPSLPVQNFQLYL